MNDRGPHRRALIASVGFLLLGTALIATARSGFEAVVGWLGLLLGLAGVVVCGGVLLGWITPPTGRPRPARRRPAAPAPERTSAMGDPTRRTVPELSRPGQDRVAEIVAVLSAAGVLAPRAPDPRHLHEAVADYGEPVTVDSVLGALHEADHYHPDFEADAHRANLAFHDSHCEQLENDLRHQVGDLAGLVRVPVAALEVRLDFAADGAPADRAVIRLSVGGRERTLDYAPSPKYLSTVLHVAVARELGAVTTAERLAWLWCDQGVWITALPADAVGRLNAALGLNDPDAWEWVHEQTPVAAGHVGP